MEENLRTPTSLLYELLKGLFMIFLLLYHPIKMGLSKGRTAAYKKWQEVLSMPNIFLITFW